MDDRRNQLPQRHHVLRENAEEQVTPEAVHRKLRIEYHYAERDSLNKVLDDITSFVAEMRRPELTTEMILQKAANFIHDKYFIRRVVMGIRCADGKYRYRLAAGATPAAWEAHKNLSYTLEEFFNPLVYKARKISEHTNLFLREDHPFTEEEKASYNRPLILSFKRSAVDEYLEGDYLNVLIRDDKGALAAWIETTGTTDGKLPNATTIRAMELIGSVVGTVITLKNAWEYKGH